MRNPLEDDSRWTLRGNRTGERHIYTLCAVCNRAIYQWYDIPLFPEDGPVPPRYWTHFRYPHDRHRAIPKLGVLDSP